MNYSSLKKTFNQGDSLIKEVALNNPNNVLIAIKKMSLSCNKDFEAKINGKTVFIKESYGLEIDYNDPDIKEFTILTDNVDIYCIFTFASKEV